MARYIDRDDINGYNKVKMGFYIVLGVIMLVMLLLLIISIEEGDTHFIVTSAVLLGILFVECMSFAYLSRIFSRASRYASILEEDHDGVITFQRLSEMTGYKVSRVKKDMNRLLRTGRLQNAVVDDEKLILWSETEYLDITCPTCGAVNQVRIGSSNKCKHCGSYLRRV